MTPTKKKIVIEFDLYEAGASKIEAHGFQGRECEIATRPLEELLGAVTQKVKKPEAYEQKLQVVGRVKN